MIEVDVPRQSAPRPVGTYIVTEPDEQTLRFGPGPLRRTLYMNRFGGTYTQGNDNSATNTSIVPNGSGTVSAWSYGDQAWQSLMSCVRDMYARFDIEITEVDPGNTDHIESVVGGTPGQVGQPNYVGGVAPVNGDCSVVERGIVFTFAGVYQGDIQAICETVAQESAHALGLDHEFLCEDPMTYLGGCGAKTFQDINAQCGENGPRVCMCGDQTQNSVQILYDVLGPAQTDTTSPSVDISNPVNGSVVQPGFAVEVLASDNAGVTRVELFIDGSSIGSDTAGPYQFTTPDTLAPGVHVVEARAFDAANNLATDSISVTIESDEPSQCPTCPVGTHCEVDVCVPDDINPGDTGSPCDGNQDCVSGMCGSDGDTRLCTEECTNADTCPGGFICTASTGGGGVCWPGSDLGGGADDFIRGGCSVGTGGPSGGVVALLLVALAAAFSIVLTRRRR
jgi:MYXO-CTERM domain-containing protein